MRATLLAATAVALCPACGAAAGDRPSYDPAIEAAAIAILQKKLPEIRKSHGIGDTPAIVRPPPQESGRPGAQARIAPDANAWL